MTLIAAGMGFAIRGGILGDWGAEYGFTKIELGEITGGGLVGFGIVILAASLITDRVGYKTLMVVAFVLHVLSAVVTLAADPIYGMAGKEATYWCLYIGMFMFAVGNGLCEAVINPLVATLYPNQKTHYLNILHAGWPGGLIIGGLAAQCVVGRDAWIHQLHWTIPMLFFLVPTLIYGIIVLVQRFPISEARAAGVSYGQMLFSFASPLLLFLLLIHACVGYVELGTDSWISNITETIAEGQGLLLFVYASSIMFVLRFFAGPIVERINPLGLLFISACLGAVGLYLIGMSEAAMMVWIAVTIYGLGKTFFWPTMLGVVGERFPKGGAITMGFVGGVGMLSAGFLGGPGIGYKQDYYASAKLKEHEPTYERFKANKENAFLFLPEVRGLDGQKVGVILDKSPGGPGTELAESLVRLRKDEQAKTKKVYEELTQLETWWEQEQPYKGEDKPRVQQAVIYGGQMALKLTALVPAFMAVCYLILVLYFRAKGGYKVEVLHGQKADGEKYTGGVEAPIE